MRNELSIEQLAAMFRAGHKYNVQHLRNAAKRRLLILFPIASLQQWKPFDECARLAKIVTDANSDLRRLEELSVILTLIRDFPVFKNLKPLVLYACCQLPIEVLVAQDLAVAPQNRCSITQEDKRTCIWAIRHLAARKLEVLSAVASSHGTTDVRTGCYDVRRCDKTLLLFLQNVMKEASASRPSPLQDITLWYKERADWKTVCAHCKLGISKDIDRLRLEVWNDLGTIFDVPSWQSKGQAA